jgi:hypothetical protein
VEGEVKVKILSGNQTGAVVEMGQAEAEANLATGFAELVPEVPGALVDFGPGVPVTLHGRESVATVPAVKAAAVPTVKPKPAPPKKPAKRKKGS